MENDKNIVFVEKSLESLDVNIIDKVLENDSIAILGAFPKDPKLADKWKRLVAKLIDFSLFFSTIFVVLIAGSFITFSTYDQIKIESINRNCTDVEKIQNLPDCQEFAAKVIQLSDWTYFIGLFILTAYFIILPQTLGKKTMKIKIISQDNAKITVLQRFAREILLIIMLILSFLSLFDAFNFFKFFGYNLSYLNSLILITMFFGNFRILLTKYAFHDQIAQTKVVEINILNKNN